MDQIIQQKRLVHRNTAQFYKNPVMAKLCAPFLLGVVRRTSLHKEEKKGIKSTSSPSLCSKWALIYVTETARYFEKLHNFTHSMNDLKKNLQHGLPYLDCFVKKRS